MSVDAEETRMATAMRAFYYDLVLLKHNKYSKCNKHSEYSIFNKYIGSLRLSSLRVSTAEYCDTVPCRLHGVWKAASAGTCIHRSDGALTTGPARILVLTVSLETATEIDTSNSPMSPLRMTTIKRSHPGYWAAMNFKQCSSMEQHQSQRQISCV
ncbi:hypothetical protein GN244_ATG20604 [Phytophthora infestans]|uniref:Uncharacterized protein n=1 Tax=Phytophthora infestans TaxID=4787 RepID=A0A833SGH5_PHYIN|nr:hypothetical protein GN244_ATG20604 [Phytophthora infestans]